MHDYEVNQANFQLQFS